MVAAIAGTAAGQVLRVLASALGVGTLATNLATVGTAISAICTLMVVIGLLYLLVNVWWIRRSLRCPPPRLDAILQATPTASRG